MASQEIRRQASLKSSKEVVILRLWRRWVRFLAMGPRIPPEYTDAMSAKSKSDRSANYANRGQVNVQQASRGYQGPVVPSLVIVAEVNHIPSDCW